MNQPTGWGQPNNWGQPAPAAPQPPAGPPQLQQPPPGYPAQQMPPQAPPGYPMQPPPGYPQMPPGYPPQMQAPPGVFAPPALPPQPNFQMNPFAGLTSGDQTASRNPYLEDGDYILDIESIKAKPARSGKLLFIIETEVVQSNNPNRPAGMRCSSFIDMSNRDLAGRHLAAFTTAIHGFDPTKLPKDSPIAPWADAVTGRQMKWEEYALYAIHDSNPWAKRRVGCRVATIETKAGDDFSLHTWIPASMMVIGPMRQAAPVAAPAPAGLPAGWGVAPGAPAAAPQQAAWSQQQQAPAAPAAAPQAPAWGNPAAQGWGQPGR